MTGIPRDLDLTRLLTEQDFVRRLAHSLLFEAADAEDVAQQAWLATLQQPPRDASRARPFLARVVRRAASNLRRARTRRIHHEGAAARADQTEACVAEALARQAQRAVVVEELSALPEPYRTSIVLRFFEERSPQQIAAQLGEPAGTVRARLSRGLQLLRERLDRRHGGDRSLWCTALLPLAQGKTSGVLTGAVALGAFAMHKLILSAAALLALAGILWWSITALPAPHDAAAPESTSNLAGAAPATEAIAAAARELQATRVPTTAASVRAETGLRGRLLLPDGQPAAGRTVTATSIDQHRLLATASEPDLPPVCTVTTRSGDDGRFVLLGIAPGGYSLLHAARGEALSACRTVPATPAPRQVVDLGDLTLAPRATLTGVVTDQAGAPLADVEVLAAELPAAPALLAVTRLVPERGVILAWPARRDQEVPNQGSPTARTAQIRDALSRALTVPIPLDGQFELHAVALPTWLQTLWQALPVARTRSDAQGRFALHDLDAGTVTVLARRAGHAPTVRPGVRIAAEETRDLGALALASGQTLRATILHADGTPARDAEVRVACLPQPFHGLAACEAATHTDQAGQFRVAGLATGQALVAVRTAPERPFVVLGPTPLDAPATLHLPPHQSLQLQVRGPKPSEVRVQVSAGPSDGEFACLRQALAPPRRDVGDAIVLDGLPSETLAIELSAPGFATVSLHARPPARLEVALAPELPRTLLVVDGSGRAIPGAELRVAVSGDAAAQSCLPWRFGMPALEGESLPRDAGVTDAQGRAVLVGWPDLPLTVRAEREGYGLGRGSFAAKQRELTLVLRAAASLTVQLRDRGELARGSDFQVVAQPAADTGLPTLAGSPDQQGVVHITGLSAGAYTLRLRHAPDSRFDRDALISTLHPFGQLLQHKPRRVRTQSLAVVLSEGEHCQLALDIAEPPPRREVPGIEGRIEVDGRAAAELHVQLWIDRHTPSPELTTTTDAAGAFRLPAFPEGEHMLRVRRGRDVLVERRVSAGPGSRPSLLLALATASLTGRLELPPQRSAAGATVRAVGPEGAVATVPADANGSFAFAALPAGPWRFTAQSDQLTGATAHAIALPCAAPIAVPCTPRYCVEVVFASDLPAAGRDQLEVLGGKTPRSTSRARSVTLFDLEAGRYTLAYRGMPAARGEVELSGGYLHRVELSAHGLRRLD